MDYMLAKNILSLNRLNWRLAADLLGYSRLVTFKKWCENQCIGIYKDIGSNKYYVRVDEFIEIINKKPEVVKFNKYSGNADEVASKMKLNSQLNMAREQSAFYLKANTNYKPNRKHELNFLSRLESALNKNSKTKS